MLNNICIKNFIIIDSLDLDFSPGLTVVTGETGAGKSIIIDAIELALGGRSDSQQIGKHGDQCDISLSFNIDNIPEAQRWLCTNEYHSENECIIRRVTNKEGRSKAFINGHTCTLHQIRDLANNLITIHGQHQHQALLKRTHQRTLLDNFAQCVPLAEKVYKIYQEWHSLNERIQSIKNANKDNTALLELLTYQVNELDELNIQEGEYEKLDTEHKQLANAETQIAECHTILENLAGDNEINALSLLNKAQRQLMQLPFKSKQINNGIELLNNAEIQTQEAIDEVHEILDNSEINPEKLQQLDIRLQKTHELSRKHHCNPEDLHTTHQQLKKQLDDIQNADVNLDELEKNLSKLTINYFEYANKLTTHRKKASGKLSIEVTKIMQHLSLVGGKFSVEISTHCEDTPQPYGMDFIEFTVNTNAGMSLQPLNKVASGGEISRIALAIYVITAKQMTTPVLVFDEVDVGIGGSTADVLGQLLNDLGKEAQVLSITHLPQVAAHGHQHFCVQKIQEKNHTQTQIKTLNPQEKINEIARMLGGAKITEKTIAHAKEMLILDCNT